MTDEMYKELKKSKSDVYIGVCCPGPVNTNFNNVANVKFSVKAKNSEILFRKLYKNRR